MPDAHANFAVSQVATAPSPALSGTSLTVQAGHGARFPTPPFNATVWPNGALATPLNAEIVRVSGIAGDVLTIARTQEGSTARAITVGDQIAAAITAKTLTDIESPPRARLYMASTQVVASGASPALALASSAVNLMVFSGNGAKATKAGWYRIFGHVTIQPYSGGGNGYLQVLLEVNGTPTAGGLGGIAVYNSENYNGGTLFDEVNLAVNDVVTLALANLAAGSVTINAALLVVEYVGT